MPLLGKEVNIFPEDLLDREELGQEHDQNWWALYTLSRRKKELTRRLRCLEIACYCPTIANNKRSASGRVRTSYIPLFQNYVFIYGDATDRHKALTTNCISRDLRVADGATLTQDLRNLQRLIDLGAPLTAESRLQPGQKVRIRSGMLRGMEGTVFLRRDKKRLMIAVDFL